jgi:YebC/PmpR family DNA-binding regulatory protein
MSGHSKWSKIKHKKAINDAKRGKVFSKLLHQITSAAREGGPDINSNPTLRLLVEKAKAESLPKNNIERAIARGAGISKDGKKLETAYYEGFSADGIGVIAEVITDNTNRTVSELRTVFSKHGGRLGDNGSVSWNFDVMGRILIASGVMKKSEKYGEGDVFQPVDSNIVIDKLFEFESIEDIKEPYKEDDKYFIEILTDPKDLSKVKSAIEAEGWVIEELELARVVKTPKKASEAEIERLNKLVSSLEDIDDVQRVWTEID